MTTNTKKELLSYLDNLSLFIIGITLIGYPLLFTSLTTDLFTLPKQLLLATSTILLIVILGIKMVIEGRVRLKTSPFDLPVLLFLAATFLSAILAVNKFDSLISFAPLFFTVLFYFVLSNTIRGEKQTLFAVSSLLLGTTVATIIFILSYFKIHILPFSYTQIQGFSPLGSLLDQAIFLAVALPLAGYISWPVLGPILNARSKSSEEFRLNDQRLNAPLSIAATVTFAILLIGLGLTIFTLTTSQKPLILPLVTGFQTGLAAISQDSGRILQGFAFGSGYGTYVTDFTRFKQAIYNTNPTLWSFTFFRSSSLFLELLATTGVLGLGSFLFIIYRVIKERTFFLPVVVIFTATLLLPFSFTLQAMIFIILGIFVALRSQHAPSRYADLDFYLVTLKHGLILAQPEGERAPHDPVNTRYGKILPFAFVLFIAAIVGVVGYQTIFYTLSDLTFQRSLVAASRNDAQQTYNLQVDAIELFPYRDSYHRVFSQTNLTIANAIASNQPQNSSPSADVQQRIVTLIQQSISYGRNAVTLSPQNALNWNTLSQTYRSLIGFGQNAEQFAVLTNQQAIALDPNNPTQYVSLGGIYYQLGLWDDAIRQFQLAANLKDDYANAYYNLGHAYENKATETDLRNALQAYQIVSQLVAADKGNADKIKAEIEAVQAKLNGQASSQQQAQNPSEDSSLSVDQPSAQLPEQKKKAEIPAPPQTSLTPTPTPKETGTPEPTPNL
ncbi:MAG: tetratricopeptide repeat protein [Candidatus Levybacteria bacterium]|nr:tetratricopeptide repeat protein [Candidatus Levybacteria bacterium]